MITLDVPEAPSIDGVVCGAGQPPAARFPVALMLGFGVTPVTGRALVQAISVSVKPT